MTRAEGQNMKIAVLALQGAFLEHEQMLRRLGADTFEIRKAEDWEKPKDGLIIPGGESTTQAKLLMELELMEPVREAITGGLPVWGTCAGLILLADHVANGVPSGSLGTMSIDVCRNAYGRQSGSFFTTGTIEGIGDGIPMTFIRAPYISRVRGNARILAECGGHIVAAIQDHQFVTSFHPELNDDPRVHAYFLRLARQH